MDINAWLASQWLLLDTMMPSDFEQSAKDMGLIQRARKVVDASMLLRLALIYATAGGLRVSSALAAQMGIVDMSDVALLKRLREASKWLASLPAKLLADRRQFDPEVCQSKYRIRLMDATCVSRPGSKGTDFRVHMGYNLAERRIDSVEITDARGGETLKRIVVNSNDIIIGDRGYSHAKGISYIVAAGGHVIVRMNWNSLPVVNSDGSVFDIMAHLRSLQVGTTGDWCVQIPANLKKGVPEPIPARVIALHKSQQAADEARRKLRAEYKKNGKTPTEVTLEAAGYIFVLTTVPACEMSAEQCLEIYRFRWQIELSFKYLKSVAGLGQMYAKSADLSIAYISAVLILAILVERMSTAHVNFSPWGYGTPKSH